MNYSNNNNKPSPASKEKERAAAASLTAPPLDILEHMLHNNRIGQKKKRYTRPRI